MWVKSIHLPLSLALAGQDGGRSAEAPEAPGDPPQAAPAGGNGGLDPVNAALISHGDRQGALPVRSLAPNLHFIRL